MRGHRPRNNILHQTSYIRLQRSDLFIRVAAAVVATSITTGGIATTA